MSTTLRTRSLAAAALVAVASIVSASLPAQTAPTDRWDAWIGCWRPAGLSLVAQPTVCVAPAGANAVAITTTNGDTIVSHDTVVADGQRHNVHQGGCDGWQQAGWSDDARRVYLHSSLTCDQTLARSTDGLLAFSPAGEWLDVQKLDAGGAGGVRVVRYREVTSPGSLPADVAAAIEARRLAIATERSSMGGPVAVPEVIDVAHHVDSTVAAAWLNERAQGFSLDGRQLVTLANAGVPGIVTDVMVALSYPKQLAVDRAAPGEGTMVESAADSSRIANAYLRDQYAGYWPYSFGAPAFGYGYGSGCSPFGYGYSPYDPYTYSGFGYGYGGCGASYLGYGGYPGYAPYGYGAYGYGYGGFYTPVVVIPGAVGTPHGRAVNGHGYTTNGGGTTGRTATPRGSTSPSSGSAPARTAVPRGSSGKPETSSMSSMPTGRPEVSPRGYRPSPPSSSGMSSMPTARPEMSPRGYSPSPPSSSGMSSMPTARPEVSPMGYSASPASSSDGTGRTAKAKP